MQTTRDIPDITECLQLFDQFEMYDNIRAHSQKVALVADALVTGLETSGKVHGPLPEREMVIAGALLHDIAKTMCIQTGCHHAEVGYGIVLELGYPEIAEIVAEHVVLKEFHRELYREGLFSAKEIVYYADKRVKHDQIVPLTDRLGYIIDRYSNGNALRQQFIRNNFNLTMEFESFLFAHCNFGPDDITENISTRLFPNTTKSSPDNA
jgi:putative nucleotidyltransferase with HDIG domain